jgi:hypothetical protein
MVLGWLLLLAFIFRFLRLAFDQFLFFASIFVF